jgi:hypothetical protein
MEKEEKELNSQSEDQEELSNSEFGFVYDFFISVKNSESNIEGLNKEKPKETDKITIKYSDQSLTFFLPDFFTDEI